MKRSYLLVATVAASLAVGACKKQEANESSTAPSAQTVNVARPASGDWSEAVAATPAGGFQMGNPDAKVHLIEIGALTCPHCREFDETGVQPLIDNYVKSGKVLWEFRPYLLSGLDVPANMIVQCNGAQSFFPLMRALYKDQNLWLGKIRAAPPEQLQQMQNLAPAQQFLEFSKLAGLQEWAAPRGVPHAKSDQCLKDQAKADQLVQQTSDIQAQYPDFKGTPSFILNGELLDIGATWVNLEPEIKKAL
jgi:protein-disulfide isomerase